MNAIAAIDKNWGIGSGGGLLFRIPSDMSYFKKMTLGKTVIMGRKTLESLPGSRPLPGRDTIVLSGNPGFRAEGTFAAASLRALFEAVSGKARGELFVCGGESIYTLLLPYCTSAYLTKIEAETEADRFFPNLDRLPSWRISEKSGLMEDGGLRFFFTKYENRAPMPFPG